MRPISTLLFLHGHLVIAGCICKRRKGTTYMRYEEPSCGRYQRDQNDGQWWMDSDREGGRERSRDRYDGPTSVHQLFDDKTEKAPRKSFDVSFLDFVPCIACTHLTYSLSSEFKRICASDPAQVGVSPDQQK